MRTGSLRAATQADPGQRATPQKSRLARQGERPYRGRQAGPSGATARARKSAGGVEKSPPCGLMRQTYPHTSSPITCEQRGNRQDIAPPAPISVVRQPDRP